MQSKSPLKRYPLERSPLYRLRGKGKFETVVGVQWDAVPKLLDTRHYRVWTNEKGREIQAPHRWLSQVHKRIGELLGRIELPDYVYSQKGRSYADNARAHRGGAPLIKTDISRFYPSVTRQAVFRMFLDDFQCAVDVAHRLADVCCYKQAHLPTGSALSGQVAYWAKRHMFDEIASVAQEVGCKMTAYVDDVTISGAAATKRLLGAVRQTIGRHGLNTKGKKSKTYAGGAAKVVTGAVVVRDEVRLPNARHLNIHHARQAVQTAGVAELLHAQRVLAGRLQEARQVLNSEWGRLRKRKIKHAKPIGVDPTVVSPAAILGCKSEPPPLFAPSIGDDCTSQGSPQSTRCRLGWRNAAPPIGPPNRRVFQALRA